jgi:hypothetical protein
MAAFYPLAVIRKLQLLIIILDLIGWSEDQEAVLEKKLSQLIYGDLITEGSSAYHYKGIADDVLYLNFYHKYNFEIYHQESNVQGEL